jgi:hypothetical protein
MTHHVLLLCCQVLCKCIGVSQLASAEDIVASCCCQGFALQVQSSVAVMAFCCMKSLMHHTPQPLYFAFNEIQSTSIKMLLPTAHCMHHGSHSVWDCQ